MELSYLEFNEGGSRPLVVLHGLFGSARNWASTAKLFKRRVIALDLRNHGDSPWGARHDYPTLAQDVADFIARHDLGKVDLLGHSMGGKAAMALALEHGDLIENLIVADIAPIRYPSTFMRYAQAMKALDVAGKTRRAEIEPLLAEAVPDPGVRGFLTQNLVSRDGGLAWRVNLDALIAHMPDILGFPDFDDLTFERPAVFIFGTASDYVRPEHHAAILRHFPDAQFHKIEGAGHWLHAEKPQDFAAAVEEFLT